MNQTQMNCGVGECDKSRATPSDFFQEHGYWGPVPMIPPEIAVELAQRFYAEAKLDDQTKLPTVMPHYWEQTLRWVYDLATLPEILDVVQAYLGEDLLLFGTRFWYRAPHSGEVVPWHQDGPYWTFEPCRAVTAWINLGVCTPDNGAIRIIPGSHRVPFTYTPTDGSHPNFDRAIEAGAIEQLPVLDLTIQPGEVLFMTESLVHASGSNNSDFPRLALSSRYCPASSRFRLEPEDSRRLYVVRGAAVPNLNDTYLYEPPSTFRT